MQITFRKIMGLEIGLMVILAMGCYLLRNQLVGTAQAKETDTFELYIEQADGKLVKYSPQLIEKILSIKPKPKLRAFKIDAVHRQELRLQVYQQYRLYQEYGTGSKNLQRIAPYHGTIVQAANYFGYEPALAYGLIAVESMGFKDAVSEENAVGLTQILTVPKARLKKAKRFFKTSELDLYDPRHNIFLGLGTLKDYTEQRHNDLLLGLVAFNFGPNRSSVVSARNFSDLQVPDKIKTYPLKVLAMTLMAKVKAQHGQVLAYNQTNKKLIEAIPLPGIDY